MTSTWVVYESMFGNTRHVAQAIAEGLKARDGVELHEVGQVPTLPTDLELLVIGGPTHAFGLSRASTREDAGRKGGRPVESAGIGVREWLEVLTFNGRPPAVAAFDTRVNHPRMPGSAAHKLARRLRRLGCAELTGPETFWVHGTKGPLADGEIIRATAWGRQLGRLAGKPPPGPPVV